MTWLGDLVVNQARFIVEKCDNKLRVENKKKKDLIATMIERGYDPDPVLIWKEAQRTEQEKEAEAGNNNDDDEDESTDGQAQDSQYGGRLESVTAKDYDYLLSE